MNFQIKRISSSCSSKHTATNPKKQKPRTWKPTNKFGTSNNFMQMASLHSSEYQSTLAILNPEGRTRTKTKHKRTMEQIFSTTRSAMPASKLRISSTSWCLYDQNRGKYVSFREKNQRQIASLTKIMTTILSIEIFEKYQINSQLYVKVTENASKMIGTTAGLKYKTWIKFKDLFYGAMLPSGNDAAYLLSQMVGYFLKLDKKHTSFLRNLKFLDISNENTTSYTVEFVKLMNKKAEQLGMKFTQFSNPHGLQNAMNTSCPKDLIMLSVYVAKNGIFRKIMNSQTHKYQYIELVTQSQIPHINPIITSTTSTSTSTSAQSQESQLQRQRKQHAHLQPYHNHSHHVSHFHHNHNHTHTHSHTKQKIKIHRLIWQNTNLLLSKGWEGVKTGQTGSAGSCLASLKNNIYIVVLNCRDNQARFIQTQKIYNWYVVSFKKSQSTTDDDQDSSFKEFVQIL